VVTLVDNFEIWQPTEVAVAAQLAKLRAVNAVFATMHVVIWLDCEFIANIARLTNATKLTKAITHSIAKAVRSLAAVQSQHIGTDSTWKVRTYSSEKDYQRQEYSIHQRQRDRLQKGKRRCFQRENLVCFVESSGRLV